MVIKKLNDLNIEINKQKELILAFHDVYLLKHLELKSIFQLIVSWVNSVINNNSFRKHEI